MTALRLADELGPDRLTTGAVAEAIGVSQPAIFRHFPTKQALWLAVAQTIRQHMIAGWQEALSAVTLPEKRIAAVIDIQLRTIELHPAIPAILFSRELQVENVDLRQTFAGLLAAFHQILCEELDRGQKAGVFRADIDPADGAVLLISLVQGVAIRWSLGARGFELRSEGKRLLTVQLELFSVLARKEDRT
ncbi:MAG TPA: TetR/AcrR family transcriptional regulator [Pararhizobium sp.]|uniref:TetR/AcrR family transcriptional regulator n=1 Tax=Pararhizobium sp. TaxID=1977563 RepID=UPI002C9CAAB8|nr:TetR/AcrR family transcriptional regulator [Pararhizobium sp.]HTO33122.1 TetR/AcrR family transcriptional regulator [Pararhizobium sp.]